MKDYIEKFEYNLKYGEKYNIPTWGHLVEEKTDNGEKLSEAFLHIKYPVILAFSLSGYVKLDREHVKMLRTMLEKQCDRDED